ncbi:GntR family transcriptional regulator [Bordetella petrii]|uniref:GntR family transcriptional regulator n=1 Tax=Bordetella petrii TaxID=94624 RepID=UPI001E5D7255|nr:GntR family transcriptional regulator [Bordetella petrii]MCD0504838.1 GntR family transcriptional regulator [Bordetella petrii]
MPTASAESEPTRAPGIPKRTQVADLLRDAMLSGRLLPGTRLIEREICELTQASRPLVREAILQLEMEGFVYSAPNRGSVVATLTADEAANIYQVRGVLEGLAAKNFIAMATAPERQALRTALDELQARIDVGDVPGQLASIEAFYDALLDGCYNPTLAETLRLMHGRIARLRATSITSPGRATQSHREMSLIVDAIDAHDEQAAWNACVRHMELTAAVALKVISRIQSKPTGRGRAAGH